MIRTGKCGIVRRTGKDLTALRLEVFARDRNLCQWPGCGVWCRFERDYPDSGHLAHRRNKQMWGDTAENTRVLCSNHHLVNEHQYGGEEKPCPPKERKS